MSRSTAIEVSALRRKVDVARAVLDLKSDAAFAEAIGIRPSTLAGYFASKNRARDMTPETILDAMSALLAGLGRLTPDQARAAWLADFDSFFLAIAAGMGGAFERLLTCEAPRLEMRLALCAKGLGAVEDDIVVEDAALIPAGARFQVAARGWARAYFVAFVRSSVGWQMAAPRAPRAIKFEHDGMVRAPNPPLRFLNDGGEHLFVGFAIDANAPPNLLARGNFATPLSDAERDRFAVELADSQKVKRFAIGQLGVVVSPG